MQAVGLGGAALMTDVAIEMALPQTLNLDHVPVCLLEDLLTVEVVGNFEKVWTILEQRIQVRERRSAFIQFYNTNANLPRFCFLRPFVQPGITLLLSFDMCIGVIVLLANSVAGNPLFYCACCCLPVSFLSSCLHRIKTSRTQAPKTILYSFSSAPILTSRYD